MKNKDKIKLIINDQFFKSDNYIKKLCYVNGGFLNIGNIWCFDYALSNLPSDNPIVEIGSFCGLSANVITYLKLRHKVHNKLICIDSWDFSEGNDSNLIGSHPSLSNKKYTDIIKQKFRENIILFSDYDLPFPCHLKSKDFFQKWKRKDDIQDIFQRKIQLGGKITFAYIDGNHDYDFAKKDFEEVDKYLEIGGFILFDDSSDYSDFGVAKFMSELCNCSRYKLINRNPNYFFQKLI